MKRASQAAVAILGLTLAGTVFARHQDEDSYFDYARVVHVDRIVAQTDEPATREECWQEPVDEFHPGTMTYHSKLPPIVSSGSNDDRTAVRDGYVDGDGYYTRDVEEHCRTRTEHRDPPVVAYDVVYQYDGEDYHDRIRHNPGSRVRVHVEDGYVEIAE